MGLYYSRPSWRGLPRHRQIDPVPHWHWQSPPVFDDRGEQVHSWSGRWVGHLHVEEAGTYTFRIDTPNRVTLYLDGRLVHTPRHGHAISIELSPGQYPLDIWFDRGQAVEVKMTLFWTPPGEQMQVIPTRNLTPYLQGYGPGTPFPEHHP